VRRASAARETGVPYAPGLAALGLPGGRVAFVTPQRREDALWAAEEAAKAGGVVLVELDAKSLDLAVTRRLQLAAEAGASLVLAFSPHGAAASVARTRWRIAARPGPKPSWAPAGTEGLCGGLAWRAELLHAKAGRAGVFDLEWVHEARGFHLAAGLGGHADAETPLRLRCAGA
jgi:protein ImuA